MKILLLGNKGQLGRELLRTLQPLGEIASVDFPEIDLSKRNYRSALSSHTNAYLKTMIENMKPDVIINSTAYTDVDRAENETEACYAINGEAPGFLGSEAKDIGAALVHFSTDYVFDGEKGSPYAETDPTNPLNIYGLSKLQGEKAVIETGCAYLIFRTSWVYDLVSNNFVTKVLKWSRQQKMLRLVSDQVSNPTWARMLAEVTTQLLAKASGKNDPVGWINEHRGLYHLAGSGWTSRLNWGKTILQNDPHKEEQITNEILPALTRDFPSPANRPLFSALDCDLFSQVFELRLPSWEKALKLAMESPYGK